ncbi:MAG: hypothetical protein AAF231_00115 [Pseudomonadota bacterium]
MFGIVSIASAQAIEPGGRSLDLTLGQSFQYSDNIDLIANPEGETLRSSTSFGLEYADITRNQSLRLSLRGVYEVDDENDEVSDPFAELSYALEGSNTRLAFSANFRRTDLDDAFVPLELLPVGFDPVNTPVNEIVRIEAGIRTDRYYEVGFETGMRSNIGFKLDLSQQDRGFSDVSLVDLVSPTDLADSRVRRVDALTTFRIDPAVTATIFADAREYKADDVEQVERTDTNFGIGASFGVSPSTTLDVALGQRKIERTRDGVLREADGVTLEADLDRALPNGSIGVDFISAPTLNGRDNTLRVNRAMELTRNRQLSYGIGVSNTADLGSEPLFSLAYVQPLKRGRFGVTLNQETRTEENSDEAVVLTSVTANYALALSPNVNWSVRAGVNDIAARSTTGSDRRGISLRTDLVGRINNVSSWSLGGTLGDTRVSDNVDEARERRFGVQMAYRREMTRDWNMVAQYQHFTILDDDEDDRRSNTISLGLERTFSFRP